MKMPYNVIRSDADLDLLRATFDDLPRDAYLDDGQRSRALARYSWQDGVLTRLPERAFYQSSEVNGVEGIGGVQRAYPPIADEVDRLPGFAAVVADWMAEVGVSSTTFSVHQIRTRAGGDPAPEGPHRDGYEYIGIYVVDRCNISATSGATSIWSIEDNEPLLTSAVIDPGHLVTIDDRRLLHDVSPVVAGEEEGPGYRDVLILTMPDHGHVADHGEFAVASAD